MNVLILSRDQNPHEFKSYLTEEFPDVNFVAAREEKEAGDFIEKAEVLVVLRISDSFLGRAKRNRNLWEQPPISDHCRVHAIL